MRQKILAFWHISPYFKRHHPIIWQKYDQLQIKHLLFNEFLLMKRLFSHLNEYKFEFKDFKDNYYITFISHAPF